MKKLSIDEKKMQFFSHLVKLVLENMALKGTLASYSVVYDVADTHQFHLPNTHVIIYMMTSCIENLPKNISQSEFEGIIVRAFVKIYDMKDHSTSNFIHILKSEIHRYLNCSIRAFDICAYLQMDSFPNWLKRRKVLGATYLLPNRRHLIRMKKQIESLMCSDALKFEQLAEMTPIRIRVLGRNIEEALTLASRSFQMIKGAQTIDSMAIQNVHGPRLNSRYIGASPFYLAFQDGEFVTLRYVPHCRISIRDGQQPLRPISEDILKRFREIPNDKVSEVFLKSLLLFSFSEDEIFPHAEFLVLWQALEALSLQESNTKEICARLSHLWSREDSWLAKYELEAIAETRNTLVHSGEFDSTSIASIQAARILTSSAIIRFFEYSKQFKTKFEMESVYTYRSFGKDQIQNEKTLLKRRISVIEKIQSKINAT